MAKISIDIATGEVKKTSTVVGIDLGTTNSLVAVYDKKHNEPIVLRGGDGGHIITPSLVHFDGEKGFTVGTSARKLLSTDPGQTVYSVKRLLGKSYSDVAGHSHYFGYKIIDEDDERMVKIQLGDRFFTPVELSAEILKELKHKAETALGHEVSKAVITVPAYFNDSQRQATRDAGKLAGLEVLRIVNEPTAASLAYGLNLESDEARNIAVYDLGGGTFDISILRIEEGVFEVLSTHGDTYLGGDDIDRSVIDYWLKHHPELNQLYNDQKVKSELRLIAEEVKQMLSSLDSAEIRFREINLSLSASELRNLMDPLIRKTLESCSQSMKDAGLQKSEINEVVLVGGSTRSPFIKQAVTEFFSHSHINDQLNPDEVVALGAAVEADILAGNRRDMLLLDVTPLSLGIETVGGLMDVIIPRNSKVPTAVGRNYTTSVDGQVNLKVSVYQGERDQVSQNRQLAEFVLHNIPAMPAGLPKIEIIFMLDADGILKVKAIEHRSGVEQEIEVQPKYGLTDQEVENMLNASLQFANDDVAFRSLTEAINESKYLILNTEKFLKNHSSEISEEELNTTQELIARLKTTMSENKKDEILSLHEQLSNYTKPFAEKMMDETISKALKGKTI
ncbi:MAG: Fe-S protein assembly chaperone HscA [Bacteroidetes bacterium]|nr:Fe-S protein assembly chaperone HscA [Bacteroidota bacterium]